MKQLRFIKRKTLLQSKASSFPRGRHNIKSTSIKWRIETVPAFNAYHLRLKYQTGDLLIEALIGLVLMAIVAVGVTTITSKVEIGKREMSVQDLAVSQLRELLVRHGSGSVNLCDSTPETITLPDETIQVAAFGCNTASTTVNGVSLSNLKQPIILSATSPKLNNAVFTVGGASAQQ